MLVVNVVLPGRRAEEGTWYFINIYQNEKLVLIQFEQSVSIHRHRPGVFLWSFKQDFVCLNFHVVFSHSNLHLIRYTETNEITCIFRHIFIFGFFSLSSFVKFCGRFNMYSRGQNSWDTHKVPIRAWWKLYRIFCLSLTRQGVCTASIRRVLGLLSTTV